MIFLTDSTLICIIGSLFGIYVLVRDLRITSKDIATEIKYAFPILLGILAWANAAYVYHITGIDSPIDTSRILMLMSWCTLTTQYRQKYQCNLHKQ